MKPIFRTTLCALAVGMMTAACQTPHDSSAAQASLNSAEEMVNHASSDPRVAKYAPEELQRSQNSLKQAQVAFQEKHSSWWSPEDSASVQNHAYLAHQEAATAVERANERAARDQFKVAAAERDSLLASANTQNTQASLVSAQGAIQFAFNDATLPAGSAPVIQRVASVLKSNPDRKVAVQGHTDSKGTQKFNMALAERRADAVRTALVNQGVDASRIETQAYGKEYPVASNSTAGGRQENRRVDLALSDNQGRVAQGPVTGAPTSTGSSGASGENKSSGESKSNEQNKSNEENKSNQQ